MTFEKVAKIIAEFKDIDQSEISMGTSLAEDLGLDSLDTVELIMSMEEEFGIPLEPDASIKTIADLVETIDKELAK